MLHIYRSAKYVLSWLGKDSSKFTTFLDFARTASISSVVDRNAVARQVEIGESLLALCKNVYWSRLWSVPEILVARQICISCGREQLLPWSRFKAGIGYWPGFWTSEITKDLLVLKNAVKGTQLYSLWQLRKTVRGSTEYISLSKLLQAYSESHCADIRDKVFALIPLSGIADLSVLNYALDRDELFTQLVKPNKLENYVQEPAEVTELIINLRIALEIDTGSETYRNALPKTQLWHCLELTLLDLENDTDSARSTSKAIRFYNLLGLGVSARDMSTNFSASIHDYGRILQCRLTSDTPGRISAIAFRLYRSLPLPYVDISPELQYEIVWEEFKAIMQQLSKRCHGLKLDQWCQTLQHSFMECLLGRSRKVAIEHVNERQEFMPKLVTESLSRRSASVLLDSSLCTNSKQQDLPSLQYLLSRFQQSSKSLV